MSNYLIIGASSGIGKKLAEQLVDSGRQVCATYFKNKPELNSGLPDYHYLNVLDENTSIDFLSDSLDGVVYCPGSINLRSFDRIKPTDFVNDFNLQVSASKGAIEGLTRALASEFAPKIRVNCIAPSLTDTAMAAPLLNTDQKREANAVRHPLKKYGAARNIADMAEFLLSDKGSWISGQIFHVDGGMSSLKV
ncbi:MAG: SDR family oxidoreductase [Bacteroidota bacterium]